MTPATATTDTQTTLSEALQRVALALEVQQQQQEELWRQTEALTSLLARLQPTTTFPPTRGWAASPDFLLHLVDAITRQQPRHIVEASSGVTTLTSAYCLKRMVNGHVTALEHDQTYVTSTNAMLAAHGLSDVARVIHAPLQEQEIDGQIYQWYDPVALQGIECVDFLIVDGPPARTCPLARYPVLPKLAKIIAPGATILLDDGARAQEQEIVRRWCAKYPSLESTYLSTEKGAFSLRWPETSP